MAAVLERFRPFTENDAGPQFTIERNVPIPSPSGRGRNPKYPFCEMGVGDSFFLKTTRADHPVRISAYSYARRHEMTFTVRTVPDGFRIWRIA